MTRISTAAITATRPAILAGSLAVIVALALVIGLFAMFGRNDTNTASNTAPNSPAATAPTTTGSGAASSSIPSNPNGTAPQRDTSQPAPAPRPASPAPATPAR